MSWAELAHERAELTMNWAKLSDRAHFDIPSSETLQVWVTAKQ